MDGGGAPNTQPGYGPNTRTIMQIQVGTHGHDADHGRHAREPRRPSSPRPRRSAASSRCRRIRSSFRRRRTTPPTTTRSRRTRPSTSSTSGTRRRSFQPIDQNGALQPAVTIPFEMKAMHDEMGGVYDTMFGRMSGMLGLTNPNSALGFILPFPYSSPPTDVVKGSLEATPIGQLADGTQLWRIFHNGVDTHPIHTHLFTAQIISRVGQDGQVAPGAFPAGLAVDATDVGWKDTFKVNPLEIIFLALRPTVPTPSQVPFEVPDSVRLIDPVLPDGAPLSQPSPAGWFDPAGNAARRDHEPHGQLRLGVRVALSHPLARRDGLHALAGVCGAADGGDESRPRPGPTLSVRLAWTDQSIKETQYRIERALDPNFTVGLTTFTPDQHHRHRSEDLHPDGAEQPGLLVSSLGRRGRSSAIP